MKLLYGIMLQMGLIASYQKTYQQLYTPLNRIMHSSNLLSSEKSNPELYDNKSSVPVDTIIASDFRFELHHNPVVNCHTCKGCKCKIVLVFDKQGMAVFQKIFIGNYLTYSAENIDSMQVGDYNFDGHTDFRLYNGNLMFHEYYVYLPSANTYIREPLLSQMVSMSFDFKHHIAVGSLFSVKPFKENTRLSPSANYLNTYRFFGVNLEYVIIETCIFQNPWNGPNKLFDSLPEILNRTDTSYCTYRNRELKEVTSIPLTSNFTTDRYKSPFRFVTQDQLMFNVIKMEPDCRTLTVFYQDSSKPVSVINAQGISINELNLCNDSLFFEDYNFDSIPDIKISSSAISQTHSFYIYNHTNASFEYHEALSKLQDIYFDTKSSKLYGRKRTDIDALTTQSDFYEYFNNQLTLIKRTLCKRKSPFSEKMICEYYDVIKGELILIQTIMGAE